jgi:hypothetical protein
MQALAAEFSGWRRVSVQRKGALQSSLKTEMVHRRI